MGPVLAIILLGCALKPIVFQSAAKIKLWYFLLVPIVYSVLCLPVVILGRQWSEVWSIYIAQAGTYQILSTNAPNPYFHIPNQYFDSVSKPGLIFASVCMFTWIVLTVNQEVKFNKERIVLAALVAVALAPYLLPKMHDRYFYPADLISFIVAFYLPRLWFLPILFQISSGLVYYRVLFKIVPHLGITIAVAINGILIAYLLWDQLFGKNRTIL